MLAFSWLLRKGEKSPFGHFPEEGRKVILSAPIIFGPDFMERGGEGKRSEKSCFSDSLAPRDDDDYDYDDGGGGYGNDLLPPFVRQADLVVYYSPPPTESQRGGGREFVGIIVVRMEKEHTLFKDLRR